MLIRPLSDTRTFRKWHSAGHSEGRIEGSVSLSPGAEIRQFFISPQFSLHDHVESIWFFPEF